jgi:ABC-type transport system involved in cytochrome bd biosynthesis fused ATPase/permease subunit
MSAEHQFIAAGMDLGYGDRQVVSDFNLTIPPGKLTVIVGANACGKSTVLPVGVITGALGAPFLLWLLVTANRKDA